MLRPLALLASVLCTGCNLMPSLAVERFHSAHYVLTKSDANMLTGPYRESDVLSPEAVLLSDRGLKTTLTLRGTLSTRHQNLDFMCSKVLSAVSLGDAYLRIDSTYDTADGGKCGVIYTPANQVFTGWDEHGVFQYETLTYVMPQLLMITQGYCLVDHSDTAYPLYEVFRKAEELARKARRGYWADPTHRQVSRPRIPGSVEGAP